MLPLVALFAPVAQAADVVYDYRGPGGEGRYTAAEIAVFLRANAAALHEVRRDGFDEWVDATRVAEISWAWLRGDAAAPATTPTEPPTDAVTPTSPEEPPAPEPRVAEPGPTPAPLELPPAVIRGAGELWLDVVMKPDGGEADALVRKAAVGFSAQTGSFSARLLVAGESSGPVRIDDAWVKLSTAGDTRGWARLGVARPAFGVADSFEEERNYWVAGRSAELERHSGWLPQSSAALTAGATGERWEASAEVADADPADPTPSFSALEARGRARFGLGGSAEAPRVRFGASVAWRSPLADTSSSRLLGALHAELNAGPVRLFAEGVGGTEGDEGVALAGGLGALAVAVPITAEALESFSIVLAGGGWDPALSGLPEAEDTPDAWYEGRAGANLAWSGAASGLITGVGYLLDVPQDAALPVDQTVVVEAAWRY